MMNNNIVRKILIRFIDNIEENLLEDVIYVFIYLFLI